MRKSLASLLLAATAPALILSACNSQATGNSSLAALPNANSTAARSHVRPDDFSPNDLHGGGATFPAYGYNLGSQPAGCALAGCSSTSAGGPATSPQAPPGTGSLFASAGLKGTVYYCLTGSGAGRGVFEGTLSPKYLPAFGPCAPLGASATGFGARQDPPDFAGSDVAMPSTEYANYYKPDREPATGTNWGEPFEFPVIGGPIVYGYRPQDFAKSFSGKTIRLSTWSYCAIANGTISDWNDPAITADNGASVTGGKSEPITFYFRSDGSGTSYNFVYHLNTACKSTWKAPYNAAPYQDAANNRNAQWTYGPPTSADNWPGPGSAAVPNSHFLGENGNPGVLAAVQSTPFSVGYLEGAWAKSANPAVAQTLMQTAYNKKPQFADPTNVEEVEKAFSHITASSITYGGGSDELPLATSRPECILYVDAAKLQKTPTGAYPMIAVSYMLFYGKNNGFHTLEKKNLIKFMTSKKATTIESSLEYIPLNSGILTAVDNALAGGAANGGKAPCLQ